MEHTLILSEYNQAAVGPHTVNVDVRSPIGVQASCSLDSLHLAKKLQQDSKKLNDNKSKFTSVMKTSKESRPGKSHPGCSVRASLLRTMACSEALLRYNGGRETSCVQQMKLCS